MAGDTAASKYAGDTRKPSSLFAECSFEHKPCDIVEPLASLEFLRSGMNLCIFGASDSGKTYLAKALGAKACREFKVAYYHYDELVGDLAAMRKTDYPKYKKKLQALTNLNLVILDDFLLHPITEDDEVKGCMI